MPAIVASRASSPTAAQLARRVDDVRRAVGALASTVTALESASRAAPPDDGASIAASLARVDEAVSVLGAARAGVLTVVGRTDSWRHGGSRELTDWRAETTRQGRGAALAEERTAAVLTLLPEVGSAATDGSVTMGHVAAIGQVLGGASEQTRERLRAAEKQILAAARALPVPTLRKNLAAMAAAVEADAADLGLESTRARRFLRLTPRDGGLRVEGLLDPIAGETLQTALDAVTSVPAASDGRSPDQRRADALLDLAGHALGGGTLKAGAQVRPHLSILVPVTTWILLSARRRLLCAGSGGGTAGRTSSALAASGLGHEPPLAQLQDGTPIPFAALDVLACDALVQRVVLDAEGSPLDVGRTRRTFEDDLRRAILTRDRHCQYPGCTLRAAWCEVHHLRLWSEGGVTSAANGITLCSRHHHDVHRENLVIRVIAGGFAFAEASGTPIGTTTRLHDELLVPRRPDPLGPPRSPRSPKAPGPPTPHDPPGPPRSHQPPGPSVRATATATATATAAREVSTAGGSPSVADARAGVGLW